MLDTQTRQEIFDDEILIIENGGEIPEVAYQGSLYYLRSDPDGPGLKLTDVDMLRLKLAVVEGYRRIIIRDLILENRDKGLYRGLKRCAANWERLSLFCAKEKISLDAVAGEVCAAVKKFFKTEVNDVIRLGKPTSINCTTETLTDFFSKVGVNSAHLPSGWKSLVT